MANHSADFEKLADDSRSSKFGNTSDWVKWMLEEGYRRRMHGELLHHSIVDTMVQCSTDNWRPKSELHSEGSGMGKWKPFESVPLGKTVLVYLEKEQLGSRIRVLNTPKSRVSLIGGQFYFDAPEPTHWHPLPEPPRETDTEAPNV